MRYNEREHHFLSYPSAPKAPLSLHSLKFYEDPHKFIFESQSVRTKFEAWISKNPHRWGTIDICALTFSAFGMTEAVNTKSTCGYYK